MHHFNNGNCSGCLNVFNKYPSFYQPLQSWFFKVQASHPTFHVSCAGRGKIDQETCFSRKASNAHWLQSSHNYNCGIDTFFMINGEYRLDQNLYDVVVENIDENIDWYGKSGSSFPERPHFEIANWQQLRDSDIIKPVE